MQTRSNFRQWRPWNSGVCNATETVYPKARLLRENFNSLLEIILITAFAKLKENILD